MRISLWNWPKKKGEGVVKKNEMQKLIPDFYVNHDKISLKAHRRKNPACIACEGALKISAQSGNNIRQYTKKSIRATHQLNNKNNVAIEGIFAHHVLFLSASAYNRIIKQQINKM